jgi:hypothetical protein
LGAHIGVQRVIGLTALEIRGSGIGLAEGGHAEVHECLL